MTSSMTEAEAGSSGSSFRSWKEAQNAYCLKHGVLSASIKNVIQEFYSEKATLPWALPKHPEMGFVRTAEEVFEFVEPPKCKASATESGPASSTSTSMSMLRGATKLLANGIRSVVYFGIKQDEYDDEYYDNGENGEHQRRQHWQQEGDDALRDVSDSRQTQSDFDLAEKLINVDLTLQCLKALQSHISTGHGQASNTAIGSPPTTTKPLPHVVAKAEWTAYCSQQLQQRQLQQANLPLTLKDDDHSANVLLQLLIQNKYAKEILPTTNTTSSQPVSTASTSNTIILLSTNIGTLDDSDNIIQLAVTLFHLKQTQEQLERQMEEWANQIHKSQQAARLYKKTNKTTLALAQLRKRALYQQQIDQAATSIFNLQQVQTSIEMAQTNANLMTLLQQSTAVLKDLNATQQQQLESNPIDDFKQQLDDLEDIQTAMIINQSTDQHEEEDLLKELQALTLQDQKDGFNTTGATFVTAPAARNTLQESKSVSPRTTTKVIAQAETRNKPQAKEAILAG